MSLHDSRLSQVLPIIHCSDCGQDVLFRKLHEHICVAEPAMPTLPIALSTQSKTAPPLPSRPLPNPKSDNNTRNRPSTIKSVTANTSPLSPIRSATVRTRPALPYLEKYSKRKSNSAPTILSQPINLGSQQINNDTNEKQQQQKQELQQEVKEEQKEDVEEIEEKDEKPRRTISPIIAAALSDSDQDLAEPRTSIDERFSPLRTDRHSSDSIRIKDLLSESTCENPVRPERFSQQLPTLPRKSAARTSRLITRRGLGITTDNNGNSHSASEESLDESTTIASGQEHENGWGKSSRSTSISSFSSMISGRINIPTGPVRSSSFDSISSSSSNDNSGYFSRPDSIIAAYATTPPERPLRINSLRYSVQRCSSDFRETGEIILPSLSPYEGSSPRSSTSVSSPVLSSHEELPELERLAEEEEAYQPLTPDSASPSPSPTPPKGKNNVKYLLTIKSRMNSKITPVLDATLETIIVELEKATPTPQPLPQKRNGSDQFETMMKDIMLDIRAKVYTLTRRESDQPTRSKTRVIGTVRAEDKRDSSPILIPVIVQSPVEPHSEEDQTLSSSNTNTLSDQNELCIADDTRNKSQSQTSDKATSTSKVEETRRSLLPTPTQSKPLRRSEDKKSPSLTPAHPKSVSKSPILAPQKPKVSRQPSPTPLSQPRELRQPPSSVPSPQSRTVRRPISPTPEPKLVRETPLQTKALTKPTPVSPLQTRKTRQAEITSPTPVRGKASYRNDIESAPISPPLRPRPTGKVEVPKSSPISPSLRPRPGRETEVVVKTPPTPPPLRPRPNRHESEYRIEVLGSSSPTPPPLRPRPGRETDGIKSSPLAILSRPRISRDAESTESSPALIPKLKSTVRGVEDMARRPASPTTVQTRTVRRTRESEEVSSPRQSEDTASSSSSSLLPLSVKPMRLFRRSEDSRDRSPPAPEAQPMISRRSAEPVARSERLRNPDREWGEDDAHSNRVREHEKSPGRSFTRGRSREQREQETEEEDEVKSSPRRSTTRGREREQDMESRKSGSRDRSARGEKECSRGPVMRSEPIGKVGGARSRSRNNRGGIERCAECKDDIQPSELADSIKMAYGSYHSECMKCVQCRVFIPSSLDAHEFEGKLYCETDFAKLLEQESLRPQRRKICTGCEAPIQSIDEVVYALGKPWHEHHLFCYHCIKPIREAHIEKDGRIYCIKDYNELFLPKCNSCGLIVESNAVSAQNNKLPGKWHASCFRCQTCHKPFPDKKFYVFKDKPYCKRHYHRANNSMCMRCDEPIEGNCAQTLEDMMRIQRARDVRVQRCNTIYGDV
ncbi:hypothetical protein BGZ76_008899 [Entomortierella beljakovae]|nr:hypothetical protein BGZ76_008899 [Entomortierella beljakovae]